MFEALFILTTLDAGTRVGAFFFRICWAKSATAGQHALVEHESFRECLMVSAWGWFLYQG
jgi:carbon starvation protein CstA